MPELPDLVHIVAKLRDRLVGLHVAGERVSEPVVLRFLVRGNLSLLLGRRLRAIDRRSHFLVFAFDGLDLALNPMLAGRLRLALPGEMDERALAFALTFADTELRYVDEKRMGKAYLTASGDLSAIPGFHHSGLDILAPEFTRERLVSLLRHRRDQLRAFLIDKRALDSLGNAYADEVLFEAGLHPKTLCRSLTHDDAVRLHSAIVKVMAEAVAEVARRDEPIDVKVRDFLKVRMKATCQRCAAKIRTVGVNGMDAYFCPTCQPATRPALVDWRKTGG
jgi:formamidopyrimidine-DNA glycosylase